MQKNFEALIYTSNRSVAAHCADAMADLPIDWMMADSTSQAKKCLSRSKFNFVLIDFDAPEAESLIWASAADPRLQCLVLVLTSRPVDARILRMSHEHQFYYPVRESEVQSLLQNLSSLAERLDSEDPIKPEPSAESETFLQARVDRTMKWQTLTAQHPGSSTGSTLMKHSLSIAAQEKISSIIAAVGAIWLAHQLTYNFRGLEHLGPPAPGPIELIVVALLLWICAKHRRALETPALSPTAD